MIIAVDMDDTIENLLDTWLTVLNKELLNPVTKKHYNVKPEDIVGWEIEPYFEPYSTEAIMAPLNRPNFWSKVEPKLDAIEYVEKLVQDGHEVYIVTSSTYASVLNKMEECLFKHFPYITWDNVIVTMHKELINCDVIVDDNVKNVVKSSAKIKVVFETPHSRNDGAEGIFYSNSWKDIYEYITSKAV